MERLNKFLAHAGVGSRRLCDAMIQAGRVSIDGQRVTEPGTRIDPNTATVLVDGKPVQTEQKVYWVFHKPPGVLCTNFDPAGRDRAIDFFPHVNQRIYTVGRLDEDSEGLLLLTNDGDLANQLMHPRYGVEKTYLVQVAGSPSRADLDKLKQGIHLAEGKVHAKYIKRLRAQGESAWLRIVLNEGKNREIRRMLARLEHKVIRLRRIAIGPVKLDRLPRGKARKLSRGELEALKRSIREPRTTREHAP